MSALRSLTRRLFDHHLPALMSVAFLFLAVPAVNAQDINGDGRVDAVFTQKQRYNQVCFGNGSGAFTNCTDLIGAGQFVLSNQVNTTDAALVDFDADGDLDIALAMEGRSSVVCYNNGGGDFNSGLGCLDTYGFSAYPYNAQEVVATDLDGDGHQDLLYAHGGNAGLPLNQPNMVCFGFSSGGVDCYEFGTDAPSTGLVVGDVDGDGDKDVVVSNRGTANEVCLFNGRTQFGVNFDCRSMPIASGISATKVSNAVAAGNLPPGFGQPSDAYLDVVFANTGKNEVCFGNGNWSGSNVGFNCSRFNDATSYTTTDANAQTLDVVIADVAPTIAGAEILFANLDAPNLKCYGTFTCTLAFQPSQMMNVNIGGTIYAVSEPVIEASTGIAARDINMDGRVDVVIANDGISRTALNAYCCSDPDKVANATLHPTSVTLSGGTVGPTVDTTPPAFFGATNVTVEATGPNGANAQFTVTANDVEDGARPVTCAPVSGSLFALGSTTVTCTSADTAGNNGTATFLVSVRDTTGPVVTVPANFSVQAPAGQVTGAVTFTATATDVVDGVRPVTCYDTATNFGVTSGSQFPGGTLSIVCFASDNRLNYGEAAFSVAVTTDIDNDGTRDDVDTDDDGDGIADVIDTLSTASSSAYAFSDSNQGTVTRNGWTVSIAPTASGSTYSLRAVLSGTGTTPAVITAYCGGVKKELRLDAAGETAEWRCDSRTLAVKYVSGTPEFWKLSCGIEYTGPGMCGMIRITGAINNAVSAGSPVTADPSNTDPIDVTIFNEQGVAIGSFSLNPGESVDVSVVEGAPGADPVLRLELLNGGPDGQVVVTLFNQPVTLQMGNGPATFSLTQTVFASGTAAVTTWDPIFPANAFSPWQSQCSAAPSVGPNANWVNPHAAFSFPLGSHPWENIPPFNFSANWINAWSNLNSRGPAGQSWTKYSTEVTGEGEFVVQFLADNCSWIYVDDQLIGVQDDNWSTNGTGRYPVTLTGAGPHTLSFIIWDGGGAAGGKFRLETRQSFIDGGGDPDDLPTKGPSTTTVTFGAGPFTYTGSPFIATASVSPDGMATIAYSGDCINAGNTCTATANYDGDATHFGSTATASITIDPIQTTTTVTFGAVSFVYTGAAIEATASAGATIAYTGSCTDVGTCTATATTAGDANHVGSSAVVFADVTPAPTTTSVSFGAASYVYTGAAIEATASAGATIVYSGSCTNVGTCTATATNAGDANHTGSSAVATAEITKASTTTTVSFGAGPFVYKGTAFTASASTSPVGSPIVTYTGDCLNAGSSCTATATFGGDANYSGSSSTGSITIAKRPTLTTVTFGGGPFVYKGTAFTATATVTPSGAATIVYSGNCVVPGTTCKATATYAGDQNQLASSDSETIEITVWTACLSPSRKGRGDCAEPKTNKDNYSMKQNTVLAISAKSGVRKNDGNTPTTIELVSGTSRGTLTLAADGSFVYTPAPGFVGTDSFRYIARSIQGVASDVELVTIQVTKKRGNDDDCSNADHDRDHDKDRDWGHKGKKYQGSKKHDHDDDDDDRR